ncbi:MAG: DUF2336 domain-containing protein, partial [Methylobacteriaceae bacterium]|nr:DUF2336 domain-containing protein [Methylobacteriaceae bacterium]
IERFGEDGELREALLTRDDLPLGLRHDLAVAAAAALTAFAVGRGWLPGERAERLARESRDKAAVIIAAEAGAAQLNLARHLRQAGRLTPALLLRALLSGDANFFAAALADLAGVAQPRVLGLMREPRGAGFAALCAKAGLPAPLAPAFRAAVAAARGLAAHDGRLSLAVVSAVVDACEGETGEDLDKALALLRRFEVEAAREEARREAERLTQEALAPPAPVVEDAPVIDEAAAIEAEAAPPVVAPDPSTIAEQDAGASPAPEADVARRAA